MAEKNFLEEFVEKKLPYPFDKKLLEEFLKCSNENNAKQLLKQVASLYQGDQVFYDVIEDKLLYFDNTAKKLLSDYKDHIIHSAYVFLTGI